MFSIQTNISLRFLTVLCTLSGVLVAKKEEKKPNIVLILTDDQDVLIGSSDTPIQRVRTLIGDEGATFTNAFATTPICCPSRSGILTGLYMLHHHTLNNSFSGGCSSLQWQHNLEPYTFGATLHKQGYKTFYAGKYLNAYGYKEAGGPEHVPEGWDWWIGLVGNSRYYNYTLSINGTGQYFENKYLTTVIRNYAIEFLETMANSEESFLMVLAPPAPHTPYIPEPKYKDYFKGIKVPRTPNFNTYHLKDRHWLLNMKPQPLPKETIEVIDSYHARRWETLLSVDEMVGDVYSKLDTLNLLTSTYLIYTSDHGYHLGHFSLPWDKRQPYETDIRVPLFVRGPGINKHTVVDAPVLLIDIAPTIQEMINLTNGPNMDGRSFLPLTKKHYLYRPSVRTHFFIEYSGQGSRNTVSKECPLKNDGTLDECSPVSDCKCQDSSNNTYICVRTLTSNENTLFCEFFQTDIHCEYYNLTSDPYQLDNLYPSLISKRDLLHSKQLCYKHINGSPYSFNIDVITFIPICIYTLFVYNFYY